MKNELAKQYAVSKSFLIGCGLYTATRSLAKPEARGEFKINKRKIA